MYVKLSFVKLYLNRILKPEGLCVVLSGNESGTLAVDSVPRFTVIKGGKQEELQVACTREGY